MEVKYIVVVSLYCCNDNGVVGDGEHTSSTLWFTRLLPCSCKTILVFHHKKNLGLFSVQAPIQMLAYGCLEGLSKNVYIAITKSNIYLQHCYCTSSSYCFIKIPFRISCQFDGYKILNELENGQFPSSCLLASTNKHDCCMSVV